MILKGLYYLLWIVILVYEIDWLFHLKHKSRISWVLSRWAKRPSFLAFLSNLKNTNISAYKPKWITDVLISKIIIFISVLLLSFIGLFTINGSIIVIWVAITFILMSINKKYNKTLQTQIITDLIEIIFNISFISFMVLNSYVYQLDFYLFK